MAMSEGGVGNGGPAFPGEKDFRFGQINDWNEGMSLRDYFAAKAMQSFLQGAVLPPGFDATEQLNFVANRAYESADALLAARGGV